MRPDLLVSLPGMARLGPVFLPPVLDPTHLESSLFIRSFTHPEVAVLISDFAQLGPFSFLQSFTCMGASMFALDSTHSEPLMSSRSFMCLGPTALVLGLSRPGSVFSLLVLDLAHMRSLLLARSSVSLELVLLVLDFAQLDASVPLRSYVQLGVSLSALDFLHSGFLSLLRCSACSGLLVPFPGLARIGSVFSLLVLDFVQFDLPTSLRFLSQLELSLVVPDLSHLGMPSFLRSPTHMGPAPPLSGMACSGSSLFATDCICFGLPLLPQSFA